jgi:hypothetical protein
VAGPAVVPFGDPTDVDPDVTSATATEHGIRVRVRADASSFSVEDGLWVTTTLENVGDSMLRWITDGCATHVGVSAATSLDWAYGAVQPGVFGTFKNWALGRTGNWQPYPIHLRTVPEWAIDKGEYGCADMGFGHELKPGGRITAKQFVRAVTGRESAYGLPPAGPVVLTATFDSWYRGKPDPDAPFGDPVVARLAVDLTDGRDPALISPGQAIDVALGSPLMQERLLERPKIPLFAPTSLFLHVESEQWYVGFTYGSRTVAEHETLVVVDAREARIIEVRP